MISFVEDESVENLNIEIVVKFRISDAIDADTLNDTFRCDPMNYIKWLIDAEGLIGVVDNVDGELISAKIVD